MRRLLTNMARHKKYNPEKRTWRGVSYKKGGKRVSDIADKDIDTSEIPELDEAFFENAILTRPGESLIKKLNACVWCEGTGYIRLTGVLCPTCHGTGKMKKETLG